MPEPAVSKEDMIRAKAHAIWLEEGQPDGRADQHWLRAATLLEAELGVVPAAVEKPKRKAAPRKRS
jgi:hypothetical protein